MTDEIIPPSETPDPNVGVQGGPPLQSTLHVKLPSLTARRDAME